MIEKILMAIIIILSITVFITGALAFAESINETFGDDYNDK